jgi:hypothetical protein
MAKQSKREVAMEGRYDASARQIWFDGLGRVLRWVREWVASRSDEHLAWYVEDGVERPVTPADIDAAIAQLERIKRAFARKPKGGK